MPLLHRAGLTLLLLIVPGAAIAQPAAADAPLDTAVRAGQRVAIREIGGGTIRGDVIEASPSSITLRVSGPIFDADAVRTVASGTISSIRRSDRLWNGALIGAAGGFAATEIWVHRGCGGRSRDSECAAILTGVGWTTLVPAGAAVGALIDKFIGNQLLYRAPRADRPRVSLAPASSPRALGMAGVVTF